MVVRTEGCLEGTSESVWFPLWHWSHSGFPGGPQLLSDVEHCVGGGLEKLWLLINEPKSPEAASRYDPLEPPVQTVAFFFSPFTSHLQLYLFTLSSL